MVHIIVAELDHTIATENENLLSHSQAEMRRKQIASNWRSGIEPTKKRSGWTFRSDPNADTRRSVCNFFPRFSANIICIVALWWDRYDVLYLREYYTILSNDSCHNNASEITIIRYLIFYVHIWVWRGRIIYTIIHSSRLLMIIILL